jgi:hypothetical protein
MVASFEDSISEPSEMVTMQSRWVIQFLGCIFNVPVLISGSPSLAGDSFDTGKLPCCIQLFK